MRQHLPKSGVTLTDKSATTAGMALQGPKAETVLRAVFPDSEPPARQRVIETTFDGHSVRIGRTGYTGEDGFELFITAERGVDLWSRILQSGAAHGCQPCGLGARDTLRLEAGLPLNGSDLGPDISPIQAGFKAFVALDKPDGFIGSDALKAEIASGPARKLVGFTITEKAPPPRSHYRVLVDGEPVGEVTSGVQSPTLGYGIGFALVEVAHARLGTTVSIEIRKKVYPATLTKKRFLNRKA